MSPPLTIRVPEKALTRPTDQQLYLVLWLWTHFVSETAALSDARPLISRFFVFILLKIHV